MSGGFFTWSNNQATPTLEKLDRILMNRDWELAFPLAVAQKITRSASDHNIIVISSGKPHKDPPRMFKFEHSWLQHGEFQKIVAKSWEDKAGLTKPVDIFLHKVKNVRRTLKGWGSNLAGSRKKTKKQYNEELKSLEEMEEISPLSISQANRKYDIQSMLLQLDADEESYWYKRTQSQWLLKRDNNTEYFHRIANGRKRKNNIFSLKDGDDNNIVGDVALLNHATSYYKELFGKAAGNLVPINPDLWDANEKLTDIDNKILDRPFSEEEVKQALYEMEKNKAAGPVGLPVDFFQNCWDLVKDDIMNLFHDFYQNKLDVKRLNYGIITLLPKTYNAERIQQFRPMSFKHSL